MAPIRAKILALHRIESYHGESLPELLGRRQDFARIAVLDDEIPVGEVPEGLTSSPA